MEDPSIGDSRYFPTIALVSDYTPLSLSIIQILQKQPCKIYVLSENESEWRHVLTDCNVINVSVKNLANFSNENISLDYVLCLNIFGKHLRTKVSVTESVRFSINIAKKNSCKTIFIFNYFLDESDIYEIESAKKIILGDSNLYAGIILLGDIVFITKRQTDPERVFSNFLRVDLKKRSLFWAQREKFCVLEPETLVDEIVRNLFSLGVYGKVIGLLSKESRSGFFEKELLEETPGLKIIKEINQYSEAKVDERVVLPSGIKKTTEELIKVYKKNSIKSKGRSLLSHWKYGMNGGNLKSRPKISSKPETSKGNLSEIKRHPTGSERRDRKKFFNQFFLKIIPFTAIILFLLPFVTFFVSSGLFSIGKLFYFRLDPRNTNIFFQFSNRLSKISQRCLFYYSQIPFAGTFFTEISEPVKLLEDANLVATKGLEAYKSSTSLVVQFSKNGRVDQNVLNSLFLGLDGLYSQIGFFEAESKSQKPWTEFTSRFLLGSLNLEELKTNVINARDFVEALPKILGSEKPKRYLILFQDSNLLRPTGGSINKIAIFSFSGGEVVDIEVEDANYIDENLQGQIDAPLALRKYFDQKIWSFKEVNWDPDFPTTANKAEWFLDKAVDKPVDGVLAVNAKFLGLLDQNQKSLYQQNFKFKKTIEFLFFLFQGFKNKDLQFFLNDNQASKILNRLEWDGSFEKKKCLGNCYSDIVGLYEFADEKAAPRGIKRKASLTISLEEKLIKRKMTYNLENPTDSIYRGIVRIFVPGDAGFGIVNRGQKDNKLEEELDLQGIRGYKVADVFFEVEPGGTTLLNLSWEGGSELDFDEKGFYQIDWKKQSGVDTFPVSIRFEKNKKVDLYATPVFSLTGEDFLGYNTDLSRDYLSRIFWNKKLNE